MRLHEIIGTGNRRAPLIEAHGTDVIERALPGAADDFLTDWRDIDDDEREPEPRRSIMRAVRAKGLDPDNSDNDDLIASLIDVMRIEAERFLRALPWNGNLLPIQRILVVKEGWERDPESASKAAGFAGLGVYWSFDNGKRFHWYLAPKDGEMSVDLHSVVRPEQVDWVDTINLHLTYSENEIRLLENTRIPILRMERWIAGEPRPVDTSHLRGQLFSVGTRADEWG